MGEWFYVPKVRNEGEFIAALSKTYLLLEDYLYEWENEKDG
jgi:hypothetical protein